MGMKSFEIKFDNVNKVKNPSILWKLNFSFKNIIEKYIEVFFTNLYYLNDQFHVNNNLINNIKSRDANYLYGKSFNINCVIAYLDFFFYFAKYTYIDSANNNMQIPPTW